MEEPTDPCNELDEDVLDYHQKVARSSYGDMLHDTERNKKYYEALKSAIDKLHQLRRVVHVLDIGTGTGLLSMMAVKCGADKVTACEGFGPMAECAKRIISKMGMAQKIHVIPKQSTEIKVGPDGDVLERANILVTEVFDTELIGEGAIDTFNHAHRELLVEDCIVVPSYAIVYAQIVQSDLVSKWNRLDNIELLDGDCIEIPDKMKYCPGAAAVHDLQLSQLKPHKQFETLSKPIPVFRYDWNSNNSIAWENVHDQIFLPTQTGIAHAVFMWWDLGMDWEGKIILSCAPIWVHPDAEQTDGKIPWRDHWMQAIYYLPEPVPVISMEESMLISCHDEYSYWFHLKKYDEFYHTSLKESRLYRPLCHCLGHVIFSRTRLGQINQTRRNLQYLNAMKKYINSESVCLCISDGSFLPFMAAHCGAKMVYTMDSNIMSTEVMKHCVKYNELDSKIHFLDDSFESSIEEKKLVGKVTVILAEPFFITSFLPWQNIHYWYLKQEWMKLLAPGVTLLPKSMSVWAMSVQFHHLWKISAPVKTIEGFSVEPFDEMIQASMKISDPNVECQPLWEYPCTALCDPFQIATFDFHNPVPDSIVQFQGKQKLLSSKACNGIVIWVNWHLTDDIIVCTGPESEPEINQDVQWDMYSKQGVYFLNSEHAIIPEPWVFYNVKFLPGETDLEFSFSLGNMTE